MVIVAVVPCCPPPRLSLLRIETHIDAPFRLLLPWQRLAPQDSLSQFRCPRWFASQIFQSLASALQAAATTTRSTCSWSIRAFLAAAAPSPPPVLCPDRPMGAMEGGACFFLLP